MSFKDLSLDPRVDSLPTEPSINKLASSLYVHVLAVSATKLRRVMRKHFFRVSDQVRNKPSCIPQKMTGGLKFGSRKVEGIYCLCSGNKGTDQLCSAPLF